ncbi:Uncharacterised protein [Mycobacteroides abscessus]|nr:Uncharacterised protein [Mycobacteroides abscessus]
MCSNQLRDNLLMFRKIGTNLSAFFAKTPMGGVSPVVMPMSWSVWLSKACLLVPTVVSPACTSAVSCSRFSARVCMGRTAWCSESSRSGALCFRPSVALSSAETVDGPVSVATIAFSSLISRLSWAPPASSLARRLSVAAPTAARMPTELSSRPRPVALSRSRNLLTVVWNNTVGSS